MDMTFKKLSIIMLLILTFCSLSAVSALDLNSSDISIDDASIIQTSFDDEITVEDNENPVDCLESTQNIQTTSSEEVNIHVGTNSTPDGNGTEDNPFASLNLARDYVNSGETKSKVTVNIHDGVYYLGETLNFNTPDLNIIGVGNSVVIKNLFNNTAQSFASSNKFTMTNVIFNASDFVYDDLDPYWFTPFVLSEWGGSAEIILNNCTFADYDGANILPYDGSTGNILFSSVNYQFNYCNFVSSKNGTFANIVRCIDDMNSFWNVTFNYCVFSAKFASFGFESPTMGFMSQYTPEVLFDSCWLGDNYMQTSTFYDYEWNQPRYFVSGGFSGNKFVTFNRYAILDVSEKYLGDNNYEIIGNLKWNDDTVDNIDKLGSMIVYLSADNGIIPKIAILENGTFKVNYTAENTYHEINITLGQQIIKLNNNINFNSTAPEINYGENRNITVIFPNNVKGTVYVTVNNKTYFRYCDNENIKIIPIDESLTKGVHDVIITFANDKNNHAEKMEDSFYYSVEVNDYGFNSTTLTVNGLNNYTFDANITPTSVYLGDNATVIINITNGVTGNLTVKVGDNEAKIFNVNDVIVIDGFVAGDNAVNITFTSDMYDSKSVVKNIFASNKPTTITTVNVTTTYNVAKNLVITLTDVNGKVLANKTINVVVGTINANLTTDDNGQASVDVSTLAPNTYVANIAFAGDDVYIKSNATANVIVNKIASSLTAPKVTTTYNVGKNLVITLTANGKPLEGQKVTVKVGTISKTLTTNAKGQVSVDVSTLTPKTYTATITYAGDTINAGSTSNATVVVNKATPKLTAKKATFKAKKKTKKYSVVLKDNKGKAIKKAKVTLKVKGKTYKATTNAKGKATFKITKLTKKGKATATIKFGGNTLYKAVTKKVKLTVKK